MEILNQDGRKGLKEHGPFDAINVGATVWKVPKVFIDQLANGGKMVIPVVNDYMLVCKDMRGNVT